MIYPLDRIHQNPHLALVLVELPGYILKFSNAGEMHHTIANFYQVSISYI
jgi:hypothetical protein